MNASASPACMPSMDSVFGPVVDGCRDNFDFTFAFEQYFFSIVPSAILLLVAPIRLYSLSRKRRRVGGNTFKYIKLSAIAVFAFLQLTSIVLWATFKPIGLQRPSVTASVLSFVTSLMFCALSYVEHSKSLAPSLILNAYLFLSLLFDAVILRTLWLTPFNIAIRNLFTASFVMKAIILVLEAMGKRRYLSVSDKQRSPEETSGLYSQGLFWWLNSMIFYGFHHILKPDDLYEINENMSAEVLDSKFWKVWNKSRLQGKYKVIFVSISVLKWPIIYPIFPRLVLLAFTFCQPLLLNRFLEYLQDENGDSNYGYALIGAYGLVYFGMAISNGFYAHRAVRSVTMLRGVLVTAIFHKTTETSITALDNSAAVTLMSTDVERIAKGLREVNELWASIIQITLATWLLQEQIGLACLAPVVVSILAAIIIIKLSTSIKIQQKLWVKEIQKRVGITSAMLGSMKGIKTSGLTNKMSEITTNLRIKEIQVAKKSRLLEVYGATLGYVPVMISPVVTFAIFTIIAARTGTSLDVSRMFTSLSLILLLTQPLFYVFIGIDELMASIGCFERIGQFLTSEARKDHRLISASALSEELPVAFSRSSMELSGENNGDVELLDLHRALGGPSSLSSISNPSSIHDIPAVLVRSGTFGWIETGDQTLHDINLSIPRSKLTILVGPVASGKSTLLKALLGEVPSSKGFVHISTSEIAWCEQTPWLINASVQRNIIGFSNFDMELYQAVIFACDLEEDISRFPDRDQSLIGSKGITLSGGQKQRIAIARAIYSRKHIAMFDDIFSGLDSTTQTNVFGRLFGPQGLLRRWKTTVVIATHAVNLLPHADQIIALGNSTVLEQGTLAELNSRRGYVHSFCLEHANDAENPDTDANPTEANQYKLGKKQDSSTSRAGLPTGKGRQQRDFSVYNYYLRTIGTTYTCIFLVSQLLWAFFTTFPTVWLKWWTDANTAQPNQQTGLYLGVYSALQITGLLSHAALVYFCFNLIVQKSGLRLHEITLRTVMRAPMSFFSNTDIGSITTRFSQDIQLIDTQLPLALMCVASYVLICIAQAVLIASATFYIAISFPPLFAVFYFVQKIYLRTSRQLRFLDLEEKAPVYTQFIETLGGLSTIRAFHWQAPLKAQNHTLVNRSQKPFYLVFIGQRWLTLVLDLITCAMAVLVVAVAVKMRGGVSVGFTGVALTQLISFTANMKLLISFWTQLETSIGAVARIKQFETDTEDENQPEEIQEPPKDWPSKGEIVFENVSASYGTGESSQLVLDNISLTIKAGERIGICGRTGSGKTTLLNLLHRLLSYQTGTIKIDSLPLNILPRSRIRTSLLTLPQEPLFLPGTVRQNLDPWNTHSSIDLNNSSSNDRNDRYISALQKVGLWTTISKLSTPGSGAVHSSALDAQLVEETLSHGQRQLFCIARAIVSLSLPSSPPCLPASSAMPPLTNTTTTTITNARPSSPAPNRIILLDEPTSSLDLPTDALMQKLLRAEFVGHTVLVVAHRLETILDCDRVVVMEGGRVVDVGEPGAVLGRVKGGGWGEGGRRGRGGGVG